MVRKWGAVALGSAVLLLAACSSSKSGSTGGGSSTGGAASGGDKSGGGTSGSVTLLVSAGVDQSGTLGSNAVMTVQSVKAAAAVVNANGGIGGKQVKVTVLDDQGDPTTAITKLQSALSSSKPLAWLDAGPSNVAAAVLPILNQNKILSFNVASTPTSSNASKFPYNFDLAPEPSDAASAFCPFAKAQGYAKVAVIYGDDAYGATLGPAIANGCKSIGLDVTGVAKYDPTALDMTPQLQQLQGGHPDALLMEGYGAPVGYVLKGAHKIGFNVPILGDLATAATDTVTTAPPSGLLGQAEESNLRVEAFQSTQYQSSDKQWAGLNSMVTALKAQGTIKASLVLAYTYDGVQLLAAAAKQAGTTTDSAALAKAIVALNGAAGLSTGVFEKYFFTASDHSPHEPPSAFAFVKPSKLIDGQFGAPGSS